MVITVTCVWVFVFIAGILKADYTPLIYVSPPMGLVLGYVTGIKVLRRQNGDT